MNINDLNAKSIYSYELLRLINEKKQKKEYFQNEI